MVALPEYLQNSFPFKSRLLSLDSDKLSLHYIQEGHGEMVVMVHGNPSWSFLFRSLIKGLRDKNYQALSCDHLGCGFSSKPQDYPYQLKNHIANFSRFMNHIKAKRVTLVVHDWGGAIGLGWAVRNPHKIKRLVITNTAAFLSQSIPKSIALCKVPVLGPFIIRRLNGFALPALWMATAKGLSQETKKGLILPYNNFHNRVALAKFVQDIPMNKNHPSYQTLLDIEQKLHLIKSPKLLLWGMKDFCFHEGFLKRWREIYPEAQVEKLNHAGHYLFEDEPLLIQQKILNFLESS